MADIIGREMGLSGVDGKNRQSHLSIIWQILLAGNWGKVVWAGRIDSLTLA